MKERFQTFNFSEATLATIARAEAICNAYAAQGYDISLRQLYYQFVSKNWIVNKEQSYKRLGDIVSEARLAGMIDWNHLVDRGRTTTTNPHWETPAEILDVAARQFRLDIRKEQPNYIEVMVEKQALEGVLEPVCRELDVPFSANKGYSSSSALYAAGLRFRQKAGKELYCIYLGDHDPSGLDMSRDVESRLSLFARTTVNVERVALNIDQVRQYNPPENPTKMTDSRAQGYVDRFGESSWELDALEPALLAALVRDKINDLTDLEALQSEIDRQQADRDKLMEFSLNWKNGGGDSDADLDEDLDDEGN